LCVDKLPYIQINPKHIIGIVLHDKQDPINMLWLQTSDQHVLPDVSGQKSKSLDLKAAVSASYAVFLVYAHGLCFFGSNVLQQIAAAFVCVCRRCLCAQGSYSSALTDSGQL